MAKFLFVVNTGVIPKKQRLFLNFSAGLVFIIGLLIVGFACLTLSPDLMEEIGFKGAGIKTCLIIALVGVFICTLAYLIAFIITLSWKREANDQKKYNKVFNGLEDFTISKDVSDNWDKMVRRHFEKPGIITLVYLNAAFSNKVCFLDCRYVGVFNKGGDYSIIILPLPQLKGCENKYFVNIKKANNYFKSYADFQPISKLLNNITIDLSVALRNDYLVLQKLHKFTPQELESINESINLFLNTIETEH